MFDNTNTYTLRSEVVSGIARYFVCFKDGQGISHEIEVSLPIFIEFSKFVKRERNLRRSDERHIEQFSLSDELLSQRTRQPQKGVEEIVSEREQTRALAKTISELPEIQRRRFMLYHYSELTYEQIAEMEGCTARAVKYSVDIAREKIKKIFQ